MRKFLLNMDALEVETFATLRSVSSAGTVRGHQSELGYCSPDADTVWDWGCDSIASNDPGCTGLVSCNTCVGNTCRGPTCDDFTCSPYGLTCEWPNCTM
jgi:hypothetical protein